MHKMQKNINALTQEIRDWIRAKNITQSELAQLVRVDQATVSRLMSPYSKRKRVTGPLIKICNYAEIDMYESVIVDSAQNRDLIEALDYVWDGSHEHARRLAKVIRQLKDL